MSKKNSSRNGNSHRGGSGKRIVRTLAEFHLSNLWHSKAELIRRIEDTWKIDYPGQLHACNIYRAISQEWASMTFYRLILRGFNEIIYEENKYRKLSNNVDEYPYLTNLETCPDLLKRAYQEYLKRNEEQDD